MKRNKGNIKFIFFLRKWTIHTTKEKKMQYVCGKQAYVRVNKDNSCRADIDKSLQQKKILKHAV